MQSCYCLIISFVTSCGQLAMERVPAKVWKWSYLLNATYSVPVMGYESRTIWSDQVNSEWRRWSIPGIYLLPPTVYMRNLPNEWWSYQSPWKQRIELVKGVVDWGSLVPQQQPHKNGTVRWMRFHLFLVMPLIRFFPGCSVLKMVHLRWILVHLRTVHAIRCRYNMVSLFFSAKECHAPAYWSTRRRSSPS